MSEQPCARPSFKKASIRAIRALPKNQSVALILGGNYVAFQSDITFLRFREELQTYGVQRLGEFVHGLVALGLVD
jgi:hypothetical protein